MSFALIKPLEETAVRALQNEPLDLMSLPQGPMTPEVMQEIRGKLITTVDEYAEDGRGGGQSQREVDSYLNIVPTELWFPAAHFFAAYLSNLNPKGVSTNFNSFLKEFAPAVMKIKLSDKMEALRLYFQLKYCFYFSELRDHPDAQKRSMKRYQHDFFDVDFFIHEMDALAYIPEDMRADVFRWYCLLQSQAGGTFVVVLDEDNMRHFDGGTAWSLPGAIESLRAHGFSDDRIRALFEDLSTRKWYDGEFVDIFNVLPVIMDVIPGGPEQVLQDIPMGDATITWEITGAFEHGRFTTDSYPAYTRMRQLLVAHSSTDEVIGNFLCEAFHNDQDNLCERYFGYLAADPSGAIEHAERVMEIYEGESSLKRKGLIFAVGMALWKREDLLEPFSHALFLSSVSLTEKECDRFATFVIDHGPKLLASFEAVQDSSIANSSLDIAQMTMMTFCLRQNCGLLTYPGSGRLLRIGYLREDSPYKALVDLIEESMKVEAAVRSFEVTSGDDYSAAISSLEQSAEDRIIAVKTFRGQYPIPILDTFFERIIEISEQQLSHLQEQRRLRKFIIVAQDVREQIAASATADEDFPLSLRLAKICDQLLSREQVLTLSNSLLLTDTFSPPSPSLVPLEKNDLQHPPQNIVTDLIQHQQYVCRFLLAMGAKIHSDVLISDHIFALFKELLDLDSTYFKLIHARRTLVLPPFSTTAELKLFLALLQACGMYNPTRPQLQVTISGRWPDKVSEEWPEKVAAIVGASMLLATSEGIEYSDDAFSTNMNTKTDARIMTYDDGVKRQGMIYDLPNADGRTDMLARGTLEDIDNYQLLGTLATHFVYGGPLAPLMEQYAEQFLSLMRHFQLKDALFESRWVFDRKGHDRSDTSWDHGRMVAKFTQAWFDSLDQPSCGLHGAVRSLIEETAKSFVQFREGLQLMPDGQIGLVAS